MTFDCTKLKGLKKRLCEGWTVGTDGGWRELTKNEHERYLASFAGEPIPPREPDPTQPKPVPNKSLTQVGPGTELETIFSSFKFPTCGRCARLRDEMNAWGIEGCEERMEKILKRLKENANRIPIMKKVFSNTAVEPLVRLAIENAKVRESGGTPQKGLLKNVSAVAKGAVSNFLSERKKLTWSYGVTTVPERVNKLLPRTLDSLSNAGFPTPHLFVDKCREPSIYNQFNLPSTIHSSNIRTFGNWVTALWELYTLSPHADRYAVFQDDFVTCLGLREYLEQTKWPGEGYLNLYTFPENHKRIKDKPTGWHRSNQLGKGAVALVFNREAIVALLSSQRLVERPQCKKRGHKYVDGGIVESFKKLKMSEYVHNPSLVQHTGTKSSMGNRTHPKAPSFPGETFDASSWSK
jgi:hypothetical protein|tara:strand:- start:4005 stop:5228 length:1224 start_codon:yes stop_codon:yes gene_type:complete